MVERKKNKFFYVYQEKKIIQKTFKIKSLYYSSLHFVKICKSLCLKLKKYCNFA